MPPELVTLVGGGAKCAAWRQVLAALASSVLIHQGVYRDYGEFTRRLAALEDAKRYRPDPVGTAVMEEQYRRFLRVYPAVENRF